MTKPPKMTWTRPRDLRTCPVTPNDLPPKGWETLAICLGEGSLTLLSLWAETNAMAMAVMDRGNGNVAVARIKARKGQVPSVGAQHPAAQRLERAAADLSGLTLTDAPDARPWLDHGRWGMENPLGDAQDRTQAQPAYDFLPVEGESLHQVPVGPVHAGIIEPGHFRFTAQGETVVRLEERLGYTHKGIDHLMLGATLSRGAELAGRVSGDSAVAYAWSFAQAAEAALKTDVPARAFSIRAIMAELERLANHLGDIGAICNDAAFAMMLAQMSVLREDVLRTAHAVFGHRAMRDRIIPGGVTVDLDDAGAQALRDLLTRIRDRFPVLVELYDNTASLLDRTVSTGWTNPDLARQFGAGGYVGRASGRDFDARRDLRYAPYNMTRFDVPLRDDGDVNARIWIRINEAEQCCALINQLVNQLPEGDIAVPVEATGEPRSGLGLVEGFRGDILVWLSLDADALVTRCHMRDPSWFQWPLLEAAIEGNIIADFPLCNKSFNCSYSGHDL